MENACDALQLSRTLAENTRIVDNVLVIITRPETGDGASETS